MYLNERVVLVAFTGTAIRYPIIKLIHYNLFEDQMPVDAIYRWSILRTCGRFKNTYELLNTRALTISTLYKNRIFNVWVRYFVEFQRSPLKFHFKYVTHALKYVHVIRWWKFKSS